MMAVRPWLFLISLFTGELQQVLGDIMQMWSSMFKETFQLFWVAFGFLHETIPWFVENTV